MTKRKRPDEKRHMGRPKGAKNKKTKEIIAKVEASGVMPLDVMLHNMRSAYKRVEEIEKVIATEDPEAIELKAELVLLREISETCAKDAAPYVHSRLSSVENTTKPYDLSKLTDKELDQLGRLLRLADANPGGLSGGDPAPSGHKPPAGTDRLH